MGGRPALQNGPFSFGQPFQQREPALHEFVILNIDQVGRRLTMFGNQYRFLALMQIGKDSRRLTLQIALLSWVTSFKVLL